MQQADSKAKAKAHEHYIRASALHLENRLDEAVDEYKKAIHFNPESPVSHNDLAVAVRDLGNLDESIRLLELAISINPDYANAYLNIGVSQGLLGKYDAAYCSYQKALELVPNFTKAHFNLGNLNMASSQPESALLCYQAALECDRSFLPAEMGLGRALREMGRLEEAIALFEEIIGREPTIARCHFELALTFRSRGYSKLAYQSLLTTLNLAPRFREALSELSDLLQDQEEKQLASKLVELRDYRPDLHATIANASALLKKRFGSKLIPADPEKLDTSTAADLDFRPERDKDAYTIEAFADADKKSERMIENRTERSLATPKTSRSTSSGSKFFDKDSESNLLYCPRYRLIYAPFSGSCEAPAIRFFYDLLKEDIPELPDCDADNHLFVLFLTSAFGIGSYRREEGERILSNPNILKYTFVESPFRRLVHLYQSWFIDSVTNDDSRCRTANMCEQLYRRGLLTENDFPAFRELIHAIAKSQDRNLPQEWRSASASLPLAELSFVGRFESFSTDTRRLRERIGLLRKDETSAAFLDFTADLRRSHALHADMPPGDLRKAELKESELDFYDMELEKLVSERYSSDFLSLGYEPKLSITEHGHRL